MRGTFISAALAVITATSAARAEQISETPSDPLALPGPVALTAGQRKARAEIVRDTAAAVGMTNAALLAGIGEVETNFAHCWSEATWACQGPVSSSCGGGPVIAGASDGPCSAQQGGLGMFQFDSGTFAQTIATYGQSIVTMQGNVDAVVPFLVTRAIESVDGITNKAQALAWMNSIKIQDGDAQYEKWLYFVSWRYNGCKGCTAQQNKYRAGTNKLRDEFGANFWKITPQQPPPTCAPISAEGRTIDDTDACFEKSGTDTSWYAGTKGSDGTCIFTYTTDDPQADNQASWKLVFDTDGRYRVEVYTDASLAQTRLARYTVAHAGGSTDVVIDQSATTGYQSLGEFEFVAGEPFSVHLGDNTGETYVSSAKIAIMFDAVRVTPADGTGDGSGDDDPAAAGCSAGGSNATSLVGLLLLGLVLRRRR